MLGLIPISDANPTRKFPVVTVVLIVINVLVFLQEPGLGTGQQASIYFFRNAPLPCQLTDVCPGGLPVSDRGLGSFLWAALFSTFLHGGFLHIGGNMLFLWIFGNNIEDHLGRVKYILFYLLGGIVATLAHVIWALSTNPACTNQIGPECVPSVGASGTVAAVMGAYLLLFPKARVNALVPLFIFFTVIQIPAWVALGLWLGSQFLIAAQEAAGNAQTVAWMAHVGGFVYGFVVIFLLGGRPQRPRPAWAGLTEPRY
jgi:membrane associated rhomboid family serine protease